jgi:hypothetical protein
MNYHFKSLWSLLAISRTADPPELMTENTGLLLLRACLLGFPRDRFPASPLERWLLPSDGLGANHKENTISVLLAACLFERVLPRKGVFWLLSLMLRANPSQYSYIKCSQDFVGHRSKARAHQLPVSNEIPTVVEHSCTRRQEGVFW